MLETNGYTYQLDETDKLIFLDTETYFPAGTRQPQTRYLTPTLRLLTWKTWNGKELSETKQIDAWANPEDPWREIRELSNQGYRTVAQNCLLPDTKILLSDGRQVNISAVTSEGHIKKVVNFNHVTGNTQIDTILNKNVTEYEGEIIELKTLYGCNTKSTPEHPHFGSVDNEIGYFNSEKFKKRDFLARPIELPARTIDYGYSQDDYYFAGLMLSDGSLKKQCRNMYFGNTDIVLVKWVEEYLIRKGIVYNLQEQIGEKEQHKTLTRVRFTDITILNMLIDLGVPWGNKSSFDSSIDLSTVYQSSKDNILAFLAGLIDGDGHITRLSIQIATASPSFKDYYLSLCMKIGLLAVTTVTGVDILPTSNKRLEIQELAELSKSHKSDKIKKLRFDTRDFLPYTVIDLINPFFRLKSIRYDYTESGTSAGSFVGLKYDDIPFSRQTFNYIKNKRVVPKRHWITQIIDIIEKNIHLYSKIKQTQWRINKTKIDKILSFYWFQILSIEKTPYKGKVYNFGTNNENYIANGLLLHNCIMFDFQPSLTNHNVPKDKEDWILPILFKGQIWDTMVVEKLLCGMCPDKAVEDFDKKDAIELNEEDIDEMEETETDGMKMRGFSLRAICYKYLKIKLDKKYQDWKYYIPPQTETLILNSKKPVQISFLSSANLDIAFQKLNTSLETLVQYLNNDKYLEIQQLDTVLIQELNKRIQACLSLNIHTNPEESHKILLALESYVIDNNINVKTYSIGHVWDSFLANYDNTLAELNATYQLGFRSIGRDKGECINGIPIEAIQYAKEDIEYLPYIYAKQVETIKKFEAKNVYVRQAIQLTHELGATTYIGQKYGVYINIEDLKRYTRDFSDELDEFEKKLINELPQVSISDADMTKKFTQMRVSKDTGGLCGVTSATTAYKIIRDTKQNHSIKLAYHHWKNKNKDKYLKPPKLSSSFNVKAALNKLGIDVQDTTYETLKSQSVKGEYPVIDLLLEYKARYALLTKTLTKMTRDCYLRSDNTVATTYNFSGPANWRSSSRNINVQQLSRELKSLYHVPPGMVKIDMDLSAIELIKVIDYAKPKIALESLKAEDQHIFFAAMYYDMDYDELLERYKNEDPEAELIRQCSKTLTYFNVYKDPCPEDHSFITGVKKLQMLFKTDFAQEVSDDRAKKLILNCERVFDTWTKEKREIQNKVKNRYQQYIRAKDSQEREAIRKFGVTGPLNHLARFYIDDIHKDNYPNAKSIYSVKIAGAIAIGVKTAVRDIQKSFHDNFGIDRARLPLTVHDSNTAYVVPEILAEAKSIYIEKFLKNVWVNGQFDFLPVEIEGYVSDHNYNQYFDDGSIVEVPAIFTPSKDNPNKGTYKRKFKKEKYRINPDLNIIKIK